MSQQTEVTSVGRFSLLEKVQLFLMFGGLTVMLVDGVFDILLNSYFMHQVSQYVFGGGMLVAASAVVVNLFSERSQPSLTPTEWGLCAVGTAGVILVAIGCLFSSFEVVVVGGLFTFPASIILMVLLCWRDTVALVRRALLLSWGYMKLLKMRFM